MGEIRVDKSSDRFQFITEDKRFCVLTTAPDSIAIIHDATTEIADHLAFIEGDREGLMRMVAPMLDLIHGLEPTIFDMEPGLYALYKRAKDILFEEYKAANGDLDNGKGEELKDAA